MLSSFRRHTTLIRQCMRNITLTPVKPAKVMASREEKLKKQAAEQPSQPKQSDEPTAYFEDYVPLQQARLRAMPQETQEKSNAPRNVRESSSVTRKEKDTRLKKHLSRPLRAQTSVSQSLTMAMQTGTLPSLFGAVDNDSEYNDFYNIGDLTANVSDLGLQQVTTSKARSATPAAPPSPPEQVAAPIHDQLGFDTEIGDLPAQWFPGHMKSAMDELTVRLKDVSLALEIRDGRVPISSKNPLLDSMLQNKIRIIVFNKSDLVGDSRALMKSISSHLGIRWPDVALVDRARHALLAGQFAAPDAINEDDKQRFTKQVRALSRARARAASSSEATDAFLARVLRDNPDMHTLPESLVACPHVITADRRVACVLTDGHSLRTIRALLSLIKALAPPRKFVAVPCAVAVCGYPNVGKSTIINALKAAARATGVEAGKWGPQDDNSALHMGHKGGRARTGADPGVTRRIEGFKVCEKPPIVVLDTPGILVPSFDRTALGVETSYKLALTGCIAEHAAGMLGQARFLLHFLNAAEAHSYASIFNLPLHHPTNDLEILLLAICKAQKFSDREGELWATEIMTTRYGRALEGQELAERMRKARLRDHARGEGFGPIMSAWARKHSKLPVTRPLAELQTEAWGRDLPSLDEISFLLSPELRDRAAAFLVQSFRRGELGRIPLDRL